MSTRICVAGVLCVHVHNSMNIIITCVLVCVFAYNYYMCIGERVCLCTCVYAASYQMLCLKYTTAMIIILLYDIILPHLSLLENQPLFRYPPLHNRLHSDWLISWNEGKNNNPERAI